MMAEDGSRGTPSRGGTSRRRVLAAMALAPVPAVTAAPAAPAAGGATAKAVGRGPVAPVPTTLSDWTAVADALGRQGEMKRVMYHTGLPRRDLVVISRGVMIKPALALGSHVSFVRYSDGTTLLMGDVVVAERELQPFGDALYEHGIEQTALHKHLLSQFPDIWWVHVHARGHDPAVIARGLRAAFDRTGTPPPSPPAPARPLDLDTAGIDAAMGVRGVVDDGVYKSIFARRETVTDGGRILPPGLGSTTAINFQPLGGGRAAVSGDCVMVADEVQDVLGALRRAGAELVEVHHHGLRDEPRLFFTHFWAAGDAVGLARGLRAAVDATNVAPVAAAEAG